MMIECTLPYLKLGSITLASIKLWQLLLRHHKESMVSDPTVVLG